MAEGEQELAGWQTLVKLISTSARSLQAKDPPVEKTDSAAILPENAESKEERDAKDTERWAKLKRLRKVFSVKKLHRSEKENVVPRSSNF